MQEVNEFFGMIKKRSEEKKWKKYFPNERERLADRKSVV